MNRPVRILALACAALLTVSLAACGDDSPLASTGDSSEIRIGSANFPESVVLAEVYAEALDGAGFDTKTTLNIGSREAYISALTADKPSLDVFPEYLAGLRNYFDDSLTGTSSDDVYTELKSVLPKSLTVLNFAPAQDKDAVVVLPATAEKYHLKSIGDLAPVASGMTLGGPPEWKTRETGVPGLKAKYGIVFGKFRELDAGGKLSHDALTNGTVDAANIFTTDPDVASGKLIALEDPNSLFAAQNVVPLVRTAVLTDKLEATLDQVSSALTQEALLDLVDQVVRQKKDPEDVAEAFVESNGLG